MGCSFLLVILFIHIFVRLRLSVSVSIRVFCDEGLSPCVSPVARSRFSLFPRPRLLFGSRPRWSRLVSPRSRALSRHLGEPDVKQAAEEQEMKGSDLAEAMASAVNRIVSAREGTSALDRAIEAVVGTIGRFSGKDATKYLASYGAEMLMRDIPEERRLAGFPRVAMLSFHAEVQAESRAWEEFKGRLLEKYGLDDALRLHGMGGVPRKGKECVGTPPGV